MRWQKAARLAIAAFVIVFAGVVVFMLRRGVSQPAEDAPPVPNTGGAVLANPGPLQAEFVEGGKLKYRLLGRDHRVFADGRNTVQNVELTLPDRSGKTFVVTSDEAEFSKPADREIGTGKFKGNVRLKTDDGIEVQAAAATYDDETGVLSVPGQVHFTRGRMKGSGVGATYDRAKDVLWLLDQARVTVAPDAGGQGALEASSGAAALARTDNNIRLTRAARIVSGDSTITADDVTALLKPGGDTIDQLQLRGSSRITGTGANARNMAARDIDLVYGPDGRTLQSARLIEQAVVDLPGQAGAAGQRIAARTIDMAMGPDGSTLTALNAADNVQLDLPAQGEAPAKTIKATSLRASGPPDAGLREAVFEGPVEYRESRPARGPTAAIERTATSLRLLLTTKPGLGDIEEADFRGRFTFSETGKASAEAPRALYHVTGDRIDLSSFEKEPGPTPFVNDGRVLVEARQIQMSPSSEKLTASTEVRSTFLPKRDAKTGPTANGETDTRMPAMLKKDQPVHVAANRMSYDGNGEATYSGAARLWQDGSPSKIDADTIVLNDRTGNLTARTDVRTSMQIEDEDPTTQKRSLSTTTATSDVLVYDDAKRLAVYTGSASKQASMKGVYGDVDADRIDVYLAETGGELERVEAHGRVTVREGARIARGDELVYTASTDVYVMKGNPVEAIERETANACKKLRSTTLTFRRAVGSISADANRMVPVQSEPVPCPTESRN